MTDIEDIVFVDYSFSPNFSKYPLEVAFNKAKNFAAMFDGITVICREHWPSLKDTIIIKGIIDAEESKFFYPMMEEFSAFCEGYRN